MPPDARSSPRLRTLAEVDAAIARDESLLARYRRQLEGLEADGKATARARELVGIVERRLVLLRRRRQSRILARLNQHLRSALLSGELSWDGVSRGEGDG
jgi:hypothetical protein